MLVRQETLFDWFEIPEPQRTRAEQLAGHAAAESDGMTHIDDYRALGAVVLRYQPRSIFEIGTYLGITSNFFLSLLPESRVVSIAYCNRKLPLSKKFNNSDLTPDRIGSAVVADHRDRFHQLLGDSHKLQSESLIEQFGKFDLVLIDGDHSRAGVMQDTDLAQKIITPNGVICWHDANPKERYLDVRRYLEDELPLTAVATNDDYIGGVACWNPEIEDRLTAATPGAVR